MGAIQHENFSDALRLAMAAGMLPLAVPVICITPPTFYDLMNSTNTKPFTILNPHLPIPGSTKTLRLSYVALPLYTIIPSPTLQAQVPPPHPIPPRHGPDFAFWDVVERTMAYAAHGAMALGWFSAIAEAPSQKDLALLRDDKQPPSHDSLDLDSMLSIPVEDDLLRVDLAELESIPLSDLYFGEEAPTAAWPKLFSSKVQPLLPPRSSPSGPALATLREGYLPDEDISLLLQIPDDELYSISCISTLKSWRTKRYTTATRLTAVTAPTLSLARRRSRHLSF